MVDEQKIADRKLSKELKDDFRAKNKIIKLLLLGTGKALYHYNITPLVCNNISVDV